jgi:glycosyltransferase involved in cell wall biosynthesis
VKTDAPSLTIAIPTYNRAAKLQAQLERLLPQLRPEVRCCVYDNASPDGTREVAERYRDRGIAYFRSEYNCGPAKNFLRCLEECQTEWLWILGDDDPISDHAVADLLVLLHNQTCDFVHTSTPLCHYASDVVVKDITSLFEHTSFGALLWISAGIYRTASFRPLFKLYNDSISTWGPLLIVVLSLLESHGGKVLLSSGELISEPPIGAGWSTLNFITHISQAPEYLADPAHQRLLAERILLEWFDVAFLVGLREVNQMVQVQRWHRIHKLANRNLKAFHARRSWNHVLANWFRAGHRSQSLSTVLNALVVYVLSWCPAPIFRPVAKVLTWPKWVRKDYDKPIEFVSP